MRVAGSKFEQSLHLIGLIDENYIAKLDPIKTYARNEASRHSLLMTLA